MSCLIERGIAWVLGVNTWDEMPSSAKSSSNANECENDFCMGFKYFKMEGIKILHQRVKFIWFISLQFCTIEAPSDYKWRQASKRHLKRSLKYSPIFSVFKEATQIVERSDPIGKAQLKELFSFGPRYQIIALAWLMNNSINDGHTQ